MDQLPQIFGSSILYDINWGYYVDHNQPYDDLVKDLETLCATRKLICDMGMCSKCTKRLGVRYLVDCTRCLAVNTFTCYICDSAMWADTYTCRGCRL